MSRNSTITINLDLVNITIIPDLLILLQNRTNYPEGVVETLKQQIAQQYQIIEQANEDHGSEHPLTLQLLWTLSELLIRSEQNRLAEWLLRRLQTAYDRTYGNYHLEQCALFTRLGETLYNQTDYATAIIQYRKSLEIYAKLGYSDSHATTPYRYGIEKNSGKEIAATLLKLVEALLKLRLLVESEEILRRLLIIFRNNYGIEHRDTLLTIGHLTHVLESTHRFEEATELCSSSLDTCILSLGKEHPLTQTAVATLARLKRAMRQYQEAEEMYRIAIEYSALSLGDAHMQTLSMYHALAGVLRDQEQYQASRAVLEKIYGEYGKALGSNHPQTMTVMHEIGELFSFENDPIRARECFQIAFLGRKEYYSKKDHLLVTSNTTTEFKEFQEEGESFDIAEFATTMEAGNYHVSVYESLFALAKTYCLECAWKHRRDYATKKQTAERLLVTVYQGMKSSLGAEHPSSIEIATYLGEFYLKYEKFSEAKPIYEHLYLYYNTDDSEKLKERRLSLQFAIVCYRMGIIYKHFKKYGKSIEYYRDAHHVYSLFEENIRLKRWKITDGKYSYEEIIEWKNDAAEQLRLAEHLSNM